MLMLLSFLRFFSFVDTGLNYNKPTLKEVVSLKAKTGEVWRFPILKSDIENLCYKDVSLEWFQENDTVNCVATQNVFKGSAGFIDLLPAEKYCTFNISLNDIVNKGFLLFLGEELLIDSSVDTITELVILLEKDSRIVSVNADGVELTITLCGRYANKLITILPPTGTDGRTIADVDLSSEMPNNCVLDLLFAEVKFPCVEGCYKLAVRKGTEVLPLAISQDIYVGQNIEGTTILSFSDSKNKFGQKMSKTKSIIRVPSVFRFLKNEYVTNERTLSNGKSLRNNTKVYDVYQIYAKKQVVGFHKMLLTAFNFENVWANGVPVFLKEFKQGEVFAGKCSSSFTLWDNKNIIRDDVLCADSCNMATIKNVNGADLFVLSKTGLITEVLDCASFVSGSYCVRIPNKSKVTTISYSIYKNGLKTTFEGDILPMQSVNVGVGMCKNENYKIKIYEKFC